MRPLTKGDVVRLRVNLPADTVKGVRALQVGHEFEVISTAGGFVKCFDGNRVKVLLPEHAVEFVRGAHSPPPDDAGAKVSKLPKRRGLVRLSEAA